MMKYIPKIATITICFLAICAIALVYFHTTDSFDQDLGRHLKLGQIIWQTKHVPQTNMFSYTNPSEFVYTSHWGSQVIFYGLYSVAGITGLILLNTLLNTAAVGMLFFFLVRRVGVLIPTLLLLPFSVILTDRTMIRPEGFSNLFFAFLLLCVFSARIRRIGKWFFPILLLLWVNLHITFVLGIVVVIIILAQDIYENKKNLINNIVLCVLCLVAISINPYGITIFTQAFGWQEKYGYTIVENQSLWFLQPYGFSLVNHIFLGILVLLSSFGGLLITKRKPSVGEGVLVILVVGLTLYFVRNETFLALLGFAVASLNLSLPAKQKTNMYAAIGSIVILLCLMFLINNEHRQQNLPTGIGNRENYRNGVTFFKQKNLHGPILNNFDIGGYLIYTLYPSEKVFVDNRPEAYPESFFKDIYIPLQTDPTIFQKYQGYYKWNTIIWGVNDLTPWSQQFLAFLEKNSAWQQVYNDRIIVIYTRKESDGNNTKP